MTATQRIYCLARPAAAAHHSDFEALMQVEAAHLWALYERGIARDAWARSDALGAVYLLESTPARAVQLLARQPLARRGLVEFEIVPVGPFTPLALLFGTQRRPICAAPRASGCGTHRVLALGARPDAFSWEDLAPHLPGTARRAWALAKAGVVRECYLRTDRPGAALVLEVGDLAEAEAVLGQLAPAGPGRLDFECQALSAFTGFDALLDGALLP